MPAQQPSRADLVVDMKTANALGLTFPITLDLGFPKSN